MELTKGYKQTEVGIIPNEWNLDTLGKISFVTKLAGFEYSLHFNSYKDEGEIIVVRGTNITHNKLDLKDVKTIPSKTSKNLLRSKLFKNDLVFAYVGTIGPVYLIEEDDRFHLGPNTAKITVNNQINSKYLNHYFKSSILKKEIIELTSIGAQPSLSMTKIRSFKIIIPPLHEQTTIANALSDADAYIDSLEKLIEKKRHIKQGAIQELLKPKDGWETKKLGDFVEYEQPGNYIVKSTEYNDNYQIPVLTAGKSFVLGYTDEEFGIFQDVPVIIFDDFTTAIKYVDFNFKVKSSAMKILLPKNQDTNLSFVYEMMQTIEYPMGVGDHKRHWIGSYQFIEIKVPTLEVQNQISSILIDMDDELISLTHKLKKVILTKQGMMQNLLTGKIRLI
jgi:type I restriction enzyme S subunit